MELIDIFPFQIRGRLLCEGDASFRLDVFDATRAIGASSGKHNSDRAALSPRRQGAHETVDRQMLALENASCILKRSGSESPIRVDSGMIARFKNRARYF